MDLLGGGGDFKGDTAKGIGSLEMYSWGPYLSPLSHPTFLAFHHQDTLCLASDPNQWI